MGYKGTSGGGTREGPGRKEQCYTGIKVSQRNLLCVVAKILIKMKLKSNTVVSVVRYCMMILYLNEKVEILRQS